VLIADTGYELYAACETVRDLDQLDSDLGMGDVTPDDVMHSACDPELRSFSVEASLKTPAALVARPVKIHYISTRLSAQSRCFLNASQSSTGHRF
jgi:hypothetical protein